MFDKKLSRRYFLQSAAVVMAGLAAAACAPKIVKETVVVEKEVEKIVKETVEVEKEVTREIVVKQTVILEKEVEKLVTVVPAEEMVTLRFHSRQVSAEEILYGQRLLEFHRDHPKIKAIHEPVPGQMVEYYPKLLTMAAGGVIGDAFWNTTGTGGHYLFGTNGVAIPVDDLVATTGLDMGAYMPAALEESSLEGELLGLPLKAHSGPTYNWYNKTAMEGAGLELPSAGWDFDDLIEVARAFSKDTTGDGEIDQFGFQPGGLSWQSATAMMRAFGGELISEDGREALLASQEALDMITWLCNCYYKWKVAGTPVQMETGGGARQMFLGRKLAMVQSGPWFSRAIDLVGNDFEVGLEAMPTGPGGERPGTLVCDTFQISSQSEHPAEAFELISYFCDQKAGVYLCLGDYVCGARPDVYEDAKIKANPMYETIRQVLKETRPTRHAHNFRGNEAGSIISQRTNALWLGEEEPTMDFLEKLNGEVQKVLDKPRD